MSEWQPIDTAPKDGSDILVVSESAEFKIIFWSEDDGEDGCWCDPLYFIGEETETLTHWMPLPEPPR